MAKPGLDGHDRGIKILTRAFRDAGMEVIYLGLRQTPAMIVNAAIQEDADVIALSILSGAHMTILKSEFIVKGAKYYRCFNNRRRYHPSSDMDILEKEGIGKLFGPGTEIKNIINYIDDGIQKINNE